MIEALQMIVNLFSNATTTALYAYIGFCVFTLVKYALFIFPITATIKYIVDKMFVSNKE